MPAPPSSHPAARPGHRPTTAGSLGSVDSLGSLGVLAIGVVAAAAALAVLLAFVTLGVPSWRVVSSGAPAEASDLLLVVLCTAGVGTTLWLGCGLVLSVLGALPGTAGATAAALAQRLAPAAVRRGAALLVGVVLAGTALPAAHAADAPPAPTTTSWGAAAPTSGGGGGRSATVPLPDPGFSITGGGDTSQTGQAGQTREAGSAVSIDGRAPDPSRGLVQPGSPGNGNGAGDARAADPGFGPTGPRPSPATSTTPTTTTPATPTPTPTTTTSVPAAPAPPAKTSPAPARPAPPAPPFLGPLGQARPVTGDRHTSVTVVRGDSLWAIAARHLGREASDAQIAHEWRRWYAANRSVIGDDADLILAGQVLIIPASTTNGASR